MVFYFSQQTRRSYSQRRHEGIFLPIGETWKHSSTGLLLAIENIYIFCYWIPEDRTVFLEVLENFNFLSKTSRSSTCHRKLEGPLILLPVLKVFFLSNKNQRYSSFQGEIWNPSFVSWIPKGFVLNKSSSWRPSSCHRRSEVRLFHRSAEVSFFHKRPAGLLIFSVFHFSFHWNQNKSVTPPPPLPYIHQKNPY